MRLRSRRTLVAAAVGLALLAGAATALAESGSSPPNSPGAATPRLDRQIVVAPLGGVALRARLGAACPDLPKPPFGDPLDAAASYLGLSRDQVAQELQSGKTLADVATARGKSVDGLKQALLDAAKADADRAVSAGDMTADEEQQLLSQLRAQLDDLVNGKGGLRIHIGVDGPGPAGVVGGPFATAAQYLGLSAEQLMQELQAGKSLGDIATEHGKSVQGLEQALIDAATADLRKAVDELVNQKGLPGPACAAKVGTGVVFPALGLGRSGTP